MGALSCFAHEMFEFGKDLFDGVQVWTVGGQEQQPGSDAADSLTHSGQFVAAQIVHDDDIACRERRYQALLDIIGEDLAVDRLVEHAWRIDPVASQGREERHRAPMPVRHLGMEPLSPRCPSAQWGHVRFGPGFIDEDEPGRIKPTLIPLPLLASACDFWPQLFGGKNAFF